MKPIPGANRGISSGGRRRSAFSKGDVRALVAGAMLAMGMLSWFSWRLVQNVVGDRAVEAGRPAAPVHAH